MTFCTTVAWLLNSILHQNWIVLKLSCPTQLKHDVWLRVVLLPCHSELLALKLCTVETWHLNRVYLAFLHHWLNYTQPMYGCILICKSLTELVLYFKEYATYNIFEKHAVLTSPIEKNCSLLTDLYPINWMNLWLERNCTMPSSTAHYLFDS